MIGLEQEKYRNPSHKFIKFFVCGNHIRIIRIKYYFHNIYSSQFINLLQNSRHIYMDIAIIHLYYNAIYL